MDSLMSEAVNRKSITMDLDIASNSFSVWAKRKTYPAVDVACKIAEKLNETVEYLVTGERKARYGLPPRVADIVQDLLGHTDYETTAGYLHTPMDMINRITESLDKAHGDDQDNPAPS